MAYRAATARGFIKGITIKRGARDITKGAPTKPERHNSKSNDTVAVPERRERPVEKPRDATMQKAGQVRLAPVVRADITQLQSDVGARIWFEAMLQRGKRDGIFMVKQTLTKPLAKHLLEVNDDNRKVISSAVEEYASAMRSGVYDGDNGETIKISLCGQMNDGQTRVHARLVADVDVDVYFIFGLRRESRMTLDQGRQRRSQDYLTMGGKAASSTITAVGNMLMCWRNHRCLKQRAGARVTRSQVAEYVLEHYEQIRVSYEAVPRKGMSYVRGATMIIFLHILLSEKDTGKAQDFIARFVSGRSLTESDPILVARNRFGSGRRMTNDEKFELLVRAWNHYVTQPGQPVSKFMLTGNVPEIKSPIAKAS